MIKVGDKVLIKDSLNSEKYYCSVLGWGEYMERLVGKTFAVDSVVTFQGVDSVTILDEHGYRWYFFPKDLENLEDESAKAFDFMVNHLS